ncbi:WD40 repeat-like protein [Basidiobolus meristosporus CBS 931.73]|uniref:WD40 repeat-like protein n=1 Tax=Basidiobolus meristosporus CBS 931.73 TaxID=1314790 RepID=A0A1Y1Y072_9FUNG|nr:WD40 repeat-like protein [Basidiobolus meristosporus CBS 931.73]|eukprot:ORX91295.1 WD40 repeat-like protein [Basidiobolus meristosporus CBS 931.73]
MDKFTSKSFVDAFGQVLASDSSGQVKRAYSICVDDRYIVCGCENGIIRLFEPVTLKYLGTLPRPHQLDVDVTSPSYQPSPEGVYPNVIAVKLTSNSEKIACIYSDRSMFIWDIKNLERVGKYRSFLYHTNCIWSVETYPTVTYPAGSLDSHIPLNSFATCSSDGTIRFWNLEHLHSSASVTSPVVSPTSPGPTVSHRGNIYSRELMHMLFVDQYHPVISEKFEDPGELANTASRVNNAVIRSIKISADGRYLASGDKEVLGGSEWAKSTSIRIHDLRSMEQIAYQEAHNGDILTIDFSNPTTSGFPSMVATAGRDRLIHIFDTLDDHSAAITSLKFSGEGGTLNLEAPYFTSYQNHCTKASVYDMDLDSTKSIIASVTQDKRIHLFGVESGKVEKSHRPESLDENTPDTNILKISLDPSGSFVATCCSDKSIRIFDVYNGNLVAKLYGHSEQVTSIKFSQDCTSLISTAGDGCIFIWSLSSTITKQMLKTRKLLTSDAEYGSTNAEGTLLQCPPKGLTKIKSMDNLQRDQEAAKIKDLDIIMDPRRGGSVPRRKVSEDSVESNSINSRTNSPESISKLARRINFPGINYTLDSSNVGSTFDPAKAPCLQSASQSSTDEEDITPTDTLESSEDEGCDEMIYLESPDDKSPAPVTYEFTIEETKPADLEHSLAEEETVEESQIPENATESEEEDSFETPEKFLEELFDSTQDPDISRRASHRQSMSARFLSSSSTVTLKSILANIPEQDPKETNVTEAHSKLCGSPITASPVTPKKERPSRHWRKRSCSLDFPIDTSDTFEIMTPPRRNRTDQELEHPRRILKNTGLLTVNTSRRDYSPKSLSPIPSPRMRQITPRKVTTSQEPGRTNREAKDVDDKVDSTTRSLQALSRILHLQRSLSQALDTHRHLFQSSRSSSTEDDLVKQASRGLANLRQQIDTNLPKQGVNSPKPPNAKNALGVQVDDGPSASENRNRAQSRADSEDSGAIESESNWTENTDQEGSLNSTPLTPVYPGFNDVLEKYSDLLVKMVEEKMERSMSDKKATAE